MNRERMNKYVAICERAEKAYPNVKADRFSNMMDIESADNQFNLRLDEWLTADDENFFHDFFGITTESDRSTFPCTFGLFVPRFAEVTI